jgi:hypothetical protein
MRIYSKSEEENVRTEELVREWVESGFLVSHQRDRLLEDLKVDLRRTNNFLRLVLFAFGCLVIAAGFLLIGIEFGFRRDSEIGLLGIAGSAICFAVAGFLIRRWRLYRFGIEESFAMGSVALLGIGAGHLMQPEMFAGLVGAAAVATLVYLRFGYVYSALTAIGCLGLSTFQIGQPEPVERLSAAALLLAAFIVARSRRKRYGHSFPGDDYAIIQAVTWAGVYGVLNLQVSTDYLIQSEAPFFYWFTYVLIWVLPAVGLFQALRERDRPWIAVNLALILVTMATNKPYLGWPRQTWDPILLGLLLSGSAIILRRWLESGAGGQRHGFTAFRLFLSDKNALSVLGTASTVIQPHVPSPGPSEPGFKPGGGRSGGGGATGDFH